MEGYTVESADGRVIVRGSIPVDEMAALTKVWKKRKLTAMALGVAAALKVTLAICRDDDVKVWESEIQSQAKFNANGDAELEWLNGTDTGISSKSIFSVLATPENRIRAEGALGGWGADVPKDPSDFGRCHRLLQKFPEWRERLPEVAVKYPKFKPMVREWDAMTDLWNEEAPTGKCPKLYDLMQTLQK